MLAPGIRAAAAENKHLWDPGCSVPVARGPAERPETVRPAAVYEAHKNIHLDVSVKVDQNNEDEVEYKDCRTSNKAVHWRLYISLAVPDRSHSRLP
ncbi:hypothetical protein STEG23_006376 [Scotinomys teguina]